jgi:hypothetical protein
MPNHQPQSPRPTLENLLELKRRERPPEAFWNEFDARLREKQLAALIPVASGLSRWFPGLGRFAKLGLPLAGAAAVAVGIVSFNRDEWIGGSATASSTQPEERILAESELDKVASEAVETASIDTTDAIHTVVIEAAPSVVAAGTPTPTSRYTEQSLNAEEITRSLPWLANVSLGRDSAIPGIQLSDPLQVEKGPTALAVTAFEESRSATRPVWAPTEQNIREAVATEIGIAPSFADKSQRSWMARLVAANEASKFPDSRVESEYPREISRLGVTASTLSIKF